MKFPYVKFPLAEPSPFFGASIIRPVIPVDLAHLGKKVPYEGLVDSGADLSIFPGLVGEALGLPVRNGVPALFMGAQTAAASAEAYLHEIELIVGGSRYRTTAGFSYDLGMRDYGILGQKGFFDIFKVRFDHTGREVELKEYRRP